MSQSNLKVRLFYYFFLQTEQSGSRHAAIKRVEFHEKTASIYIPFFIFLSRLNLFLIVRDFVLIYMINENTAIVHTVAAHLVGLL